MLNETYQKLVNKHFQNSGIDQQKLEDFTKDVIRAICDIIDNNTSMINTITQSIKNLEHVSNSICQKNHEYI